jgi:beta-lactamase regulating signal transducer with metallopeptidase domain/HEAT repeat protein
MISFSGFTISDSSVSMLMLLAKATFILLVALGITLSMQKASAGARHLVWLVTLATLLLVPALTAWAPIPLRILPATTSAAPASAPATGDAPKSKPDAARFEENPAVNATRTATEQTAPGVSLQQEIASSPILSGIWMVLALWAVVVLAIGISLGYAALMVKRIVNRARPLDSEDWLAPLWEVSDRLALEEAPRLLRSEDAKMPFACGVFTPTIVLPSECDTWSLDRRRAVLLHELAHVRRHDLVGHTLGRLACAVYWFHPLVWTAAKQLRSESERACDDLALACGARATDYAEHLLDIVTSVKRDATPAVALAMARRKEFEGRMLAILDPELRHSSPSRKQAATLIGSLALISIIVGAAAPAQRAAAPAVPTQVSRATELQLANSQKTHDDKGYPDSREIIGGSMTHKSTRINTIQTQQTSTLQLQQTTTSPQLVLPSSLESAIDLGMKAGMKTGMKAGEAVVASIFGKQAARDTDERPVLLARILATDTSPSLRRIAAWGLNDYADRQVAAEALAKALRNDRDPSVREMAAWSLNDADHSSVAIEALMAALHDADTDVRATAAWSLGNVGDRSSAEALAGALSDPSAEVRRRAVWALGNSDLKQAPPRLIAELSDKDPEVRQLTAWALYEIEDPAAIPSLQAALGREQDKELQIAYIRALAAVGEKSVDALKGLLESKDQEIRTIAVKALAGGHATGPWPRPWPQPRPYPN